MRVLVTGGAGYIGSHTAKELQAQGHVPIIYDNFSNGHRWACKWGDIVEGDVRDLAHLCSSLDRFKIDSIIHFAADAYVGESMGNPAKYFSNNVVGSITLLDAAIKSGIQSLVFSSSCATYGIPARVPVNEAMPQIPINPYGETKLIIEKALHWYSQAYSLNYAALRYFNAAGAASDAEIGEFHDPETHLIPLVIDSALGIGVAVQVLGNDYATRDGTAERDYIHVEDLARAHILALKYLAQGRTSFACNLGTGIGRTVAEVIDSVARECNVEVPFTIAPKRDGDPPSLVADSNLARKLLKWTPQKTFEDIVRDAVRWRRKVCSTRPTAD
jgi:UDP-arabinose 4-epimerase